MKQTIMPSTLPDASTPIQAEKKLRNLFGINRLISENGANELVARRDTNAQLIPFSDKLLVFHTTKFASSGSRVLSDQCL